MHTTLALQVAHRQRLPHELVDAAATGIARLVSVGWRVDRERVALGLAVFILLLGAMTAGKIAHAGILIGLSVAAPIGPIGLLCIRRTLAQGPTAGLATGLGAATAHAALGLIAASGLVAISAVLADQRTALQLGGGVLLCGLGLRALRPRRAAALSACVHQHPVAVQLVRLYAWTLPLPLLNPMTLLSFAAIIAGSGIAGSDGNLGAVTSFALGVLAGSSLWWVVLSSTVGVLRGWLAPKYVGWTTQLSGVGMALFGLLTFTRALAA